MTMRDVDVASLEDMVAMASDGLLPLLPDAKPNYRILPVYLCFTSLNLNFESYFQPTVVTGLTGCETCNAHRATVLLH